MVSPFQERIPPGAGAPGLVVLRETAEGGRSRWLRFQHPVSVLQAEGLEQVPNSLAAVESATEEGLYAAGFLTYEAAPAFDPAFVTRQRGSLPLVWFGLFETVEEIDLDPQEQGGIFTLSDWQPSVGVEQYREAVDQIRQWIARGDTYQVNYTFRLWANFDGDPWGFFHALCRVQRAGYCAYVDIGRHVLCSASPELFFSLSASRILARPMKGTAPRGLTLEEDDRQASWLKRSQKNRAENVMVVDMVRNDLGRIAHPGTVRVTGLFDIERYDSLYQMTSTVEARADAPLGQIFRALFPCASITGAPKVRTMELITELEGEPRGIYTGAIGFVGPERQAQFNVAIRTVHIDRRSGWAEYGTGGGIVWDSVAEEEYRECASKSLVLTERRPEFSLLETLLWMPDQGYQLLERHVERLAASAHYFDFPVDLEYLSRRLAVLASTLPPEPHRVRLLLSPRGGVRLEAEPEKGRKRAWRVALAKEPIDRSNRFLFHKTTFRQIYDQAHADFLEYDDVLLWNLEGELTESTLANLVVRMGHELLTPPVECGLLPGTLRAELLARGWIRERKMLKEKLAAADAIYLINSVRGWIPVTLEVGTRPQPPVGTTTKANSKPVVLALSPGLGACLSTGREVAPTG